MTSKFSPQNLIDQATRAGKSLQDFAESKANDVSKAFETSSNINVNAIADSIDGAITDKLSAAVDPVLKIPLDYRTQLQYENAELQKFAKMLGVTTKQGPPFPNELRDFASYNYVLGLGVLSTYEVNFPDETYRKTDPKIMITRSGGGLPQKATTIFETKGQIEYYIDDFETNAIIGNNTKTKQTNAVSLDFKVTEPYSMGMFLQTLQVAAVQAEYKNYLEAPYVLTLEFKGWDNNGNYISKPNLRRIFPIKIVNIDFNVTEGGSVYNVRAIPWHEQGLADQVQSTKTDITITGRTVEELLQSGAKSLMSTFNEYEQKKLEKKQVVAVDEYIITFPTERASAKEQLLGQNTEAGKATTNPELNSGEGGKREITDSEKLKLFQSITGNEDSNVPADFDAELSKLLGIVVKRSGIGEAVRKNAENPENINDIGKSDLIESYLNGGKQPFGRPKFVEETKTTTSTGGPPNRNRTTTVSTGVFKRGNITISNKGRDLTFKSGSKIQNIIEEIIILSDYGRRISEAEPDANGMIPWFKIETDVYDITNYEQMDLTGQFPKLYVFRVVPYKAHINRYMPPTKASPGLKSLEAQCCKEYNYIYTGKNDDVLEFNLEFDKAFFTSIMPFGGENKAGTKEEKSESPGLSPGHPAYKPASGDTDNLSNSGNATTKEVIKPGSTGKGGLPERTKESIARDFNDALVNSNVDLVTANMTIWGDPYYITDSGMGNYNAAETPIINLTEDGTMDYQSSEVDILVNFRTPLDYNQDGTMEFPGNGTKPVGAFSGVYQVLFCMSSLSGGVFNQQLKLIRRRNQEGRDTNSEPTTQDNKIYTEYVDDAADANSNQSKGTSDQFGGNDQI
jgi:hypothetical protein